MRDPELELEYEYEFENEFEGLGEGEGAFGEGPLGEYEGEFFGEGEFEGLESANEFELEGEGEYEGEQFFGKAFKVLGGLAKKAAPFLKNIAKVAAPMVGTAVGGPIGGAIGGMASNLLGESEYEGEFELEYEGESEAEMEAALEGPLTPTQALGELMAAAASRASTDMEAEAQIGSATAVVLTRDDLDALRAVLPNINRGVAVLTRVLRRRPETRDGVRLIPAIVKRSAVTLRKQAATGRPVTRKAAAKAMATQTRRVLGTPSICSKALQRNSRATQAVTRRQTSQQQQPRRRYAI